MVPDSYFDGTVFGFIGIQIDVFLPPGPPLGRSDGERSGLGVDARSAQSRTF